MFYHFDRPGKGVAKEEKKKNLFLAFMDIVFSKFRGLFVLNLLQVAITLPLIALLAVFYREIQPADGLVFVYYMAAILYIAVIGIPPLSVGIHYVLAQYAGMTPVFLFHDFAKAVRENIRQSMALFAVDCVIGYMLVVNIRFYFVHQLGGSGFKMMIIAFLLIDIMAHFFLYQLMIRYRLTFGKLIQKSLFLAVLNLPQNLLALAVCCLLIGLVFTQNIVLIYLLCGTFLLSLIGLYVNLYAARVIEKYEIDQ